MATFGAFLSIIVLWFAGLGAAAQFAKIGVPFADVRMLYPLADGHHGWLLSLVSLVGAFLGIVAGALVARIGLVRMLVAGLGLGAAISFWQATGLGFGAMLVSRAVEGASHLAIVVAAPTIIARIAPAKFRNAAMALWSTFFGVSFALMAWLGAPFVVTHGLPVLFIAHGIAMASLACLLALLLRHTFDAPEGRVEATNLIAAHARAYRSPYIAAPAMGWLFYTITFVSLLAIVPGLLPPGTSNRVATLMPLLSIAVSMLAVPLFMWRFSATSVVILGFTFGIFTVTLLVFGAPLAAVAVLLFGVLGLVQGASFAAVPELNPTTEDRALAYGAVAQTGNIGNLIGTPILLAVLDQGGEASLFGIVIVFYVLAIASHLWFARRRRRTASRIAS